MKWRNKST